MGCYLEFDLFGQESCYYEFSPIDMPNDAMRVAFLIGLAEKGYLNQLLISEDICTKTSLGKYGGHGYDHILLHVIPLMRKKGMTDADIAQVTVGNPARMLALAR
jgi:phosphotriesterase-related protein